MANVKFVLKEPNGKKPSLIYLLFRYGGTRFKLSTNEKILPAMWSEGNQRAKRTFPGSFELNHLLDKLDGSVMKIYREARTKGLDIDNEWLKKALLQEMNFTPVKTKGFFEHLEDFVEARRAAFRPSTLIKYGTLRNHLINFERKRGLKIRFDRIDFAFQDELMAYLFQDLQLLNNSAGKLMAMLKTFLNWATERGLNQELTYRKFKVHKDDASIVYLTESELMGLYSMDLSAKPRLERVRDTFCFGCFTGLRFSDISQLRKEHIKDGSVRLRTTKTRDNLTIPLMAKAREILEKHGHALPVICNQKCNTYLKELCKLAGIDDRVLITKYRGGEEVRFHGPKYQFISTHTARRTFVTLSLEKGMRAETVMGITGHKDYKTFKKYIKITDAVKAREMQQTWG